MLAAAVTEHYDPDERDFRLRVALETADGGRALRALFARFRGSAIDREIEAKVSREVVITHDGRLLFAYAADRAALDTARRAIEEVLRADGLRASMDVSHWDERIDAWRQIDPPPPTTQEQQAADAAERDAETIDTRMLVASSGKAIRAELEQSLLRWAEELGIECTIVEHPHLLTTQVAFTVTGPRRKLDEFAKGLAAEEVASLRAEREVMLSPL